MKVSELHQIGAYSKVDSTPRGYTITVAYIVIVDHTITVCGQGSMVIDAQPLLAFDHEEMLLHTFRKPCEVQKLK